MEMAAAATLPRLAMRRLVGSGEALPYLVPAAVLTAVLGVLPLLALLGFSLFDLSLTRSNSGVFIGLKNYLSIAKDTAFWHALGVTLEIAIETMAFQLVFGIAIALLLNRNLPGMGIIRAFIP